MKKQTDQTLHLLLSGKHPSIKEYAGKQVFVIGERIVLLKGGKRGFEDFKQLEKQYGEPPVVTFVPHPGATYILFIQ